MKGESPQQQRRGREDAQYKAMQCLLRAQLLPLESRAAAADGFRAGGVNAEESCCGASFFLEKTWPLELGGFNQSVPPQQSWVPPTFSGISP